MTHRSHNAMEGHHITSHNIFAQKPINVVYKLVASFRCRRTLKNDIHFRVAVVRCAFSPDAFFVPAIVAFWKNAQMHRSEFHGAANVVSKVWESAFWDLERKYKCQPPFASAIDVLLRAAAAQPTKHVRTIFVCFYVIFACLCVCRRSAIPCRSIISALFLLALSSSPPHACFAMYLRVQHEWQKWMCWIAYARVRSVDHVYISIAERSPKPMRRIASHRHTFSIWSLESHSSARLFLLPSFARTPIVRGRLYQLPTDWSGEKRRIYMCRHRNNVVHGLFFPEIQQ